MTVDALVRRQEYIAAIAMGVGFVWYQISTEVRAAIMDQVDGSSGLHDKIVEWAGEFDAYWEAHSGIAQDEFVNEIANFADAKIKTLIAEARLS
jgi:hypothetical protein